MVGDRLANSDLRVAARLAISCWLVSLLFLDPYPMSMAKDLLGLGVSLGEGSIVIRTHGIGQGGELAFRDGLLYSGLPPGGSVVVTPIYLLFRTLLPTEPGALLQALNVLCIILISAPFAALTPAIFYIALAELDVAKRARLEASVLLAFATTHFGYATAYFKENMTIALIVLAFALLIRGRRLGADRSVGLGLLAGLAVGIAITTVYTSVLPGVMLALYAWLAIGRRPALLFGLATVPPVALLAWYHDAAYGSPFATAYTYHLGLPPHAAWFGRLDVERLIGMVLSPGSGLFIFVPVAALGLLGLIRVALRVRAFRAEALCALGVFLAVWLLYGHYRVPADFYIPLPHDMSLVTRYLSVTVPFLLVGYALTRETWPAPLRRIAGVLTVVFGYLSAVPGLNPSYEAPLVYALKVTISTFGMGMLFGQFVPEGLGVPTFHSVVRRPHVGLRELLSGPPGVLTHLVLNQLGFLLLFLGAVAAVGGIVVWLWRDERAIANGRARGFATNDLLR